MERAPTMKMIAKALVALVSLVWQKRRVPYPSSRRFRSTFMSATSLSPQANTPSTREGVVLLRASDNPAAAAMALHHFLEEGEWRIRYQPSCVQ